VENLWLVNEYLGGVVGLAREKHLSSGNTFEGEVVRFLQFAPESDLFLQFVPCRDHALPE